MNETSIPDLLEAKPALRIPFDATKFAVTMAFAGSSSGGLFAGGPLAGGPPRLPACRRLRLALLATYLRSSGASTGHTLSSSTGCACCVGCIWSDWNMSGRFSIPASKNGTSRTFMSRAIVEYIA